MKRIPRSGEYFRVANPAWIDPLNPECSRRYGGRWTPVGEFGALYLNATVDVAAANARHQHRDRAIKLFDLRVEARPRLITVFVPNHDVIDVVTDDGIRELGLPTSYPCDVPHELCHPIARDAYANGDPGIACRSNAEAMQGFWVGEELALFERALPVEEVGRRRAFSEWYPDVVPDESS